MSTFEDRKVTGQVFNIQKYSVHDGPGIRTIVFAKGCPLKCRWCSNPESQRTQPQMAFNPGRCISPDKCGFCIPACAQGAIREERGSIVIDCDRCADCRTFDCAGACPARSLIVYGRERTVEDVLDVVAQDALFYSRSGGGMTVSGGEPLFQKRFVMALLREARRRRIRTAVETCGFVPWETLEEAVPLLGCILFDVKHADAEKHRQGTGVGNELILSNLTKLLNCFPDKPVLVRTPVVPGFNDDDDTARAIGRLLKGYANVSYEALPYHRLGAQKYTFLAREYPMGDVSLSAGAAGRVQAIVDEERGAK
ncbi:glycyl-radical enzyme activating protein [uncultured Mailhella sp.]|uniref:glycyl-radical enzyme activating protein n=1 Tax=uncultured Mailhella sp. TaxID=1981031 RepID=UPI0025D93167|nr:glycyl-radical enzyme activating protein [uncultured Mailhella sp.]